jgi:hypothetical protein
MRVAHLFLALAALLQLAAPDLRAEEQRHDGHLWGALPRDFKVSHMQGLIHGSAIGVEFTREGLAANDPCRDKLLPSFAKTAQGLLAEVSPEQIVDGVDTIFKDYRNRSLLITDAVYVALRAIGGLSPENVEKLLQSVRRAPK